MEKYLLNIVLVISIFIVNLLMTLSIYKFVKFIMYETRTELNKSLIIKLSLTYFFNTAL